jgi:hypothetical protein
MNQIRGMLNNMRGIVSGGGLLFGGVIVTTALAQALTVRPSPTTFDPFNPTLQTATLSPTTAPSDTLNATASIEDPSLASPPVRDPYRPPVRSAIRP